MGGSVSGSSTATVWDASGTAQTIIAQWSGVTDKGYTNSTATGVSVDGRIIAGVGDYSSGGAHEAWIARGGDNGGGGGIIMPSEWLSSLSASQQVYQSGQYLDRAAAETKCDT